MSRYNQVSDTLSKLLLFQTLFFLTTEVLDKQSFYDPILSIYQFPKIFFFLINTIFSKLLILTKDNNNYLVLDILFIESTNLIKCQHRLNLYCLIL